MAHKHDLQPAGGGGLYCQILGCAFELSDYETADVFTQLLKACEVARTTLQLVSDGQAYDGTALATTMLNTIKRLSAAIAAARGKDGE